jgi:cytochrome d ubiquinol oxidase subunit II
VDLVLGRQAPDEQSDQYRSFVRPRTGEFTQQMCAVGVVLRGASFALRKYAATLGQARLFGAGFAGSLLVTPFLFGTAVGGIV